RAKEPLGHASRGDILPALPEHLHCVAAAAESSRFGITSARISAIRSPRGGGQGYQARDMSVMDMAEAARAEPEDGRSPARAVRSRAMLSRLRIENLVLIRDAELSFAPGLNVITGETGAGKTILAQAFGLLLGTKGDAGFVGLAGDDAYVEAELEIAPDSPDDDELGPLAGPRPEDGDGLVGARRVFADGRTRAYAWG